MNRWKLCVLALILALLVIAANMFLVGESSIGSIDYFRYDLAGLYPAQADSGWIDRWLWTGESPYKYRVLGKLPLGPATAAIDLLVQNREQAFYIAFTVWSVLLLWGFLYLVARCTEQIMHNACPSLGHRAAAWTGALAMLLAASAPPVLFLFKYPVHSTPSDLLGYLLMTAALSSLLQRRLAWCCAISTLAVFCRETTLLVPFMLLFLGAVPWQRRLVLAGIPVATLVLYRLLWPGVYDPSTGAQVNFTMPLEMLGFLLLVFGPLWLLGVLGYFALVRRPAVANEPLLRSFPWAVLLVLAVVLFTARVREIRIIYVLFLYFVPFAVFFLYRFRDGWQAMLRNRFYLLYLLLAATLLVRVWVSLMPDNRLELDRLIASAGVIYNGYPATPEHNWLGILFASLLALLACAPFAGLLARKSA